MKWKYFSYGFKVFTFAANQILMHSFNPSEVSVAKFHGLMLGTIGPRPIAFASTIDENGNPNLAPFSFFNVFSANPPILIFSPARSGIDNSTKHTYQNVKVHKEVVINIVDYAMVQQTSLASTAYPKGVNEFEKAGFTMLPSDLVKPFRVKESPAQYECIVKEVIEMGTEGGAGNLVICEVVKLHIRKDLLNGDMHVDQEKVDLVGRMGGPYYCRAHGSALLRITKPISKSGIGIDQIPSDIKNSIILTGNDLGQLGNVEELPNETDVNEYRLTELSQYFVMYEDDPNTLESTLHTKAKELITGGHLNEAWMTLLSFNN